MALSFVVASDILSMALDFYVRGPALGQTTQDRPLLAALRGAQETFPGGKGLISLPVRGGYMSDSGSFMAGYNEADTLAFTQSQNVLRAEYSWKELHAGLEITWTEMKKDGVHVTDHNETSESSDVELTRLTGILKERLADFGESWARSFNTMLWQDGSQDSKEVPGVTALLTDVDNAGSCGGLSRATNTFWRQRVLLNIAPSETNQTLSKSLRTEFIQLMRFGGKPRWGFAGADFLEALRGEVQSKGYYTQTNFNKSSAADITMADVQLENVTFRYDPTLDDLGLGKRCFVIDPRRLRLYPMEGEDNKLLNPERPYDQAVFLRSMTWTGGLTVNQLNANGVYGIA